MKPAVVSESVSFQFLHTEDSFLKDINLTIQPGECVLICGKSGSGKTTFSRLLNGVSPNFIEGELQGHLNTVDLVAGEAEIEEYVPLVGSVFQNPKTQHFSMDTTNELAFPCENVGMPVKDISKRIETVAKEYEIESLLGRDIFKLSGGEKQQIAFSSANMLKPQVLVLDEVTSNLDDQAVERIRHMIRRMKESGITIILTEHRLAWTKGLVDRYVLFEEGKATNEWNADTFSHLSNEELHSYGLRAMDLSLHSKIIKEKMQANKQTSEAALQTKNLAIGYDKEVPVLSDLTIGFSQGETIGIMGSNGTGKSTLASTLIGLQKPLSGSILWKGKPISSNGLIKKSFLVMQDTNYQLFSDSVSEEVLIGAKYSEKKDQILEQLNLTKVEDQHPMSLSGGQKQRVAIASAILSGKDIIIFDEPTSGLDYDNMERFGKLLEELKDSGVVVIVITHDIELAANWCDQIIYLNEN
ncbi:energy-coupling factor ABC transporter ATP-binding protein [Alkalibacterium iburiense]|uniref:Energy-coupling factor ABC transporter ATP-binding protein n=1 Tax=Alkalibacterium iburiense TaxID=290589 RepID=A0ABN0XAJ6_9LACT